MVHAPIIAGQFINGSKHTRVYYAQQIKSKEPFDIYYYFRLITHIQKPINFKTFIEL